MKRPMVFCLSEYAFGGRIGTTKIAYIEDQKHWKRYHKLSGKSIEIPIELSYYLHLTPSILKHIFEVDDPAVTEEKFINAGFIKDYSFDHFIKQKQPA